MTDIMLTSLPSEWRIERLGQLFRERKEKVSDKDFEALSVTKNGIVPQLDNAAKTDDGDNRKGVRRGDFVINSRSDRKGSSGISELDGSVSLINIVLEPRRIYPRFAHHLLRSSAFQEEFYRWGHGIVADLWTTRYFDMKNIRVGVPHLATQKKIASFLDRETSRIEQLIEQKNRYLVAINERLSAQTNQILSNGLNAKAPKQAVASAILGEIPSHWSAERLRFSIRKIEQGWSPQCENRNAEPQEWAVLKVGAVSTGVFREKEHKALPEALLPRPEFEVREGDVLAARASGSPHLVGRAAYVDSVRPRLMLSDKHYRFTIDQRKLLPRFLVFVLNSPKSRAQIEIRLSSAEGMARNIGQDVLKNIWWGVPPIEEQAEIVEVLDHAVRSAKRITERVQTSMDRLRELHSSLITAAVTGRVDIATWQDRESAERLSTAGTEFPV